MSQPSENRLITSARCALCLLAASGVLLSSCASSGVGSAAQTTRAEYYPSCYEPVSHLHSTDNAVCNSTITGVITGGLLGGLADSLASDENRGRDIALVAAGGALAGDATGYYVEKQKQISDGRTRIGPYAIDVDRSTVEINRSVAYAKSAQSCYQNQFKALLDSRKSRSINEAEERKHLVKIVSDPQETSALLVATNDRAGENIDNYTQTYEKDLQQVGVPHIEVTKAAGAENRASAMKGDSESKTGSGPRVPKEAVATKQTIRKAQDTQNEGNKTASRGQDMIQEVYNSPDMGNWAPPSCAKV